MYSLKSRIIHWRLYQWGLSYLNLTITIITITQLQARPLHDCKWDKYVVGKTSPKRRRQTNRLRKETEWSTLFSRVSAGRSERPSLGVAKNVQQFVQGIRGAVRPLLKLRGTNSSPGARPSVPSPRLLLMRENLSRVVHMCEGAVRLRRFG